MFFVHALYEPTMQWEVFAFRNEQYARTWMNETAKSHIYVCLLLMKRP